MSEHAKFTSPEEISADSLLTSHEVGRMLQVNPSSINKWVKDGRIRAFRTPGGHRRIKAADLVIFLKNHQMPVPRNLSGAVRKRLLIVDDDPKQLSALFRLFKPFAERVEVQVVDNGIDALLQIGSFNPHMAILDVFMPQVDGFEILRRLKAKEETHDIMVVMTTGEITADIAEKGSAGGALRCMPKPIDVKQILKDLGVPEMMAPELSA
jgi:excisionase family DNA binding protein